MTSLSAAVLAEKAAAIERHLQRVEARVPPAPAILQSGTDTCDSVILHLWQAVQIAIDLAMTIAVRSGQATPRTYAEAFQSLVQIGVLPAELGHRLALAAGFRNRIVHAYEGLDLARVTEAARTGPADLRAFLGILAAEDR